MNRYTLKQIIFDFELGIYESVRIRFLDKIKLYDVEKILRKECNFNHHYMMTFDSLYLYRNSEHYFIPYLKNSAEYFQIVNSDEFAKL